METDLQALIEQMTLEEKAALCTGASAWTTKPIERLGIPEMTVSDGPHGVRRVPDIHAMGEQSLPATCFPTGSCLASTWDVALLQRLGSALAEECLALDVDVLLGPGVNMKRSPLGGRNFEYFSEDPYLAGELAVGYITGVQSRGVGVSVKHYAVNNQEFQRFTISAELDERTLREIYLPAFEMAVKRGHPWTVMCAYNKVNGTFASEHRELLTEILKNEWGFQGLVFSDWGAVRDRVAALRAGVDVEMPGPEDRSIGAVVAAIQSDELTESVLDESVRRILHIVLKANETPKTGSVDVDAHDELARAIAADGIVLLKNDGTLPLNGLQSIAVIGRSARNPYIQGGGSSRINPTRVAVPLEELRRRAGTTDLTYAEGYPDDASFRQDLIDEAARVAGSADAALLFVALPAFKESEGYDRQDLDLTQQQTALIQAVAEVQPKSVVVLNNGAPIAMSDWISSVSAVLEGWMMGQAGGAALADVLFGHTNPSGKLAETFPVKLVDTPTYTGFPGEAGEVRYGEGLFIGYRYYEAKEVPVLFPFGHGLSYTTFDYSNARVSAERFRDVDGVTVSIDVTNTGSHTGKEAVQVYVRDRESSLRRPEKELKGFAKVELQPGETKSISIPLDFRAFAFYHPQYGRWITEDGEFVLLIGASSADIRAHKEVTLEATGTLPCVLNRESTLREWLEDPVGEPIVRSIYPRMEAEARKSFGEGGEDRYGSDGSAGTDVMDMLDDMPLISVLGWQKHSWEEHPEDIVDDLLRQVHELS